MPLLFGFDRAVKQPTWLRTLSLLVPTLAFGGVLLFLVLASSRLLYPFELEWIEGASVDGIRWIMEGNALYSEPSISFIPMVYNPLLFFLSAALMKVIGVGFVAPRLISILSTLGCFLLLFSIVARESQHPLPGLVSVGIYAATFRFSGSWMDIAKSDSLFLCLVLAAFLVSRRHQNLWRGVISGLLYVLAYYTKQSALSVVLVMAPLSLVVSRGRTWPQWLAVAVAGSAIFWGLDAISDGWFSFYTFDMTTHHTRSADTWFFWRLLIRQMWPALLVSLFYLAITMAGAFKTPLAGRAESPWHNLSLGCSLLLSSWSVFLQRWTYDNGFMPACVGLGMLAGLGYGQVLKLTQRPSWYARGSLLRGGALVLLLFQFVSMLYNPLTQLPTVEDREAGRQFITRLSELPGEVLVFNHGFVNYLAGKNTYFHSAAYSDAVGGGAHPPRTEDNRWRREKVRQVFERAIAQQVFDWIVAGGPAARWLPYYIIVEEEAVIFHPVAGPQALPENIMIRNPTARGGSLPLTDASFDSLLSEGWSVHEDWGRWAVGQRSVVRVALEQGHDYRLIIEAFPFCPPQFEGQAMKVGWNDLYLGRHVFTSCEGYLLAFDIPSEAVTEELDTLWFEFERAISPADIGLSSDRRCLAIGLTSLSLVQKGK